ncbi:alpha/beta hydrolase [Chryseobacterium sp. CH21]|uniref:alpha/beta hydrolase n=1 Tax=Chryseobacterium sp. CH21 TaxID=713556 RepID=UPI00100B75DD|nr:alpha/beta hydrolase [Chryseobacterium sp. CH21]RXM40691.1 alpha/beta hydrolase [Chryseobacterium sp. CH21]
MKQRVHFWALILIICLNSCGELRTIKKYGLKPPTIEVKGKKAFINGTIGETFYHLFVKTLNKNPQLETIVMLEIPGSVNDEWNIKSCLLLSEKGLNTELLNNSIVESGGTDLFVSGKKLIIADGAKIGVHSWGGDKIVAAELPKNHPEHKMFLDFYDKVKVDSSFYWYTLNAAPAEGMHFMTKSEIEKYLGNKIK